jgi:hypothetical protein
VNRDSQPMSNAVQAQKDRNPEGAVLRLGEAAFISFPQLNLPHQDVFIQTGS